MKESEAVAQSFASNNLPFSQLLEQDATEGRFRAAIALHPPACLHVEHMLFRGRTALRC